LVVKTLLTVPHVIDAALPAKVIVLVARVVVPTVTVTVTVPALTQNNLNADTPAVDVSVAVPVIEDVAAEAESVAVTTATVASETVAFTEACVARALPLPSNTVAVRIVDPFAGTGEVSSVVVEPVLLWTTVLYVADDTSASAAPITVIVRDMLHSAV
jgi:hypothetical protein